MNAKSLTVIAQIKAKPGKEGQVRQELLSLVAPSRKDAGCLNYDLHQALDNPTLFLFHENWTSKAHLDRTCRSRICRRCWPGWANWSPSRRRSRFGSRLSSGGLTRALPA